MRLLPHGWANVRRWDTDDWYVVGVTGALIGLWTFAAVTSFIPWWLYGLVLIVGAVGVLTFLVFLSWLTKNRQASAGVDGEHSGHDE